VLLLQRSLQDANDPNAGLWEFPGGGLQPGEDPYAGACREFGEEVGVPVPDDATSAGADSSWDLPPDNPMYRLHHVTVPSESSIDINSNAVQNPDDPNGLNPEAVAWWDPTHIQGDHIRPEVQNTMKTVGATLTTPSVAAAAPPAPPFTKKSAPPAKETPTASQPADAATVAKVAHMLSKAADLAQDPKVKDLLTQAEDLLSPNAGPPDGLAAAAPPIPAPAVDPLVDPVDDDEKAGDLIAQARTLLQGHIDGTIPDNSASKQNLLDLLTSAHDILVPPVLDNQPNSTDALIASAAHALAAPPDDWFQPFELDGPTPLTVTADGRVFGHLATWDSCHRSGQYGNTCTRPPSDPKAPFFQMGQVLTASGATVDVGVVTVGGGHASPNKGLIAALEHYDDVSTAAATVVVHEDDYGIGLFGSVTPDADPSLVAALRRSPLSGDWRKEKGKWRLVAAHAVNTPGFPIPRGLVASVEGEAFFTTGRVEPKEPVVDLSAAARRLAKAAGLDAESMVASARAAMADLDCGCDEEETIVASLSGDTSLPVAQYDAAWDGGQAADRVFQWANGDVNKIGKAFLWRNESFKPDIKAGWDLPFADVIDGELKIVPRGVQATAGGHGVGQLDGVSDADKNAIKARIGELYRAVQATHPDSPANPFDSAPAAQ
jgi:hypothetical protein